MNHIRSSKGGKKALEANESRSSATELYMPNFCYPGAPRELSFKTSGRGKPSVKAGKKVTPAKPLRDTPALRDARIVAETAALEKAKALNSKRPGPPGRTPPAKKPKKKAREEEEEEDSPPPPTRKTKTPAAPPKPKKKTPPAPLETPTHEHRFEVGDEVDIKHREVLGRCVIIDLEPYVNLPPRWQGENGEVFFFHAVELKQVFAAARKGKSKTPVTFNAGDLMPYDENMIQDTETLIVEEEDDLQLHKYLDKVDGRSPRILIWEKFLQRTTSSASSLSSAAIVATPGVTRKTRKKR